jgi:hypothetical protein
VALNHEFVVNYIIVNIERLFLLFFLLFIVIFTIFLALLLLFAKICYLLNCNDLTELHADLLTDLVGLGNALLHCDFLPINFLNIPRYTSRGFHSRELILSTPFLRMSSTNFPNEGDSLTLIKIS